MTDVADVTGVVRGEGEAGDAVEAATTVTTYTKTNTNALYSTLVKDFPSDGKPVLLTVYNASSFSADSDSDSNSKKNGNVLAQTPVKLVADNTRAQGIVWADPCVSKWCPLAVEWDLLNRSAEMLNAITNITGNSAKAKAGDAADSDTTTPAIDFFAIVGDVFYDQQGSLTKSLYDGFSLKTKSVPNQVVLGNHDAWICSRPGCGTKNDQFGYGIQQWYAQDTVEWMNFTVNPDDPKYHTQGDREGTGYKSFLNTFSNSLFIQKIGNLGFLGYTGASKLTEIEPYLKEACAFFEEEYEKSEGKFFGILYGHCSLYKMMYM